MVMVVSDFLAFYNPVCSTGAQYCATSIYDLGCLLKGFGGETYYYLTY